MASSAKRAGIQLKQTFAKEGKALRWKAAGYAHAKQFRRLRKVVKRQRTILGIVMREAQRKLQAVDFVPAQPKALSDLQVWLERAERIRTQQRHSKNKLYALHAPEVECIGKDKTRKPYEFGVKSAVLEQTTNLMQDLGLKLKHIVLDLGFRGVDADNPDKEIIHKGKFKSLSKQQKGWLKRRTAVEPTIGHLKSDHRMDRCWLQGALGDALHSISCAARHCPPGHSGGFFASVAGSAVAATRHRDVIRCVWARVDGE